tara:strand:- start:163 stop:756 length:594 start_codon:yes stop_codon:yes gene_type:complete
MNIKELAEKYDLTKDDFWKHKQSGKWILTHDACTIIAHKENIILESFENIYQSDIDCRFLIGMSKDGKLVKSIGEANKSNCTSKYLGCMAEKRGRDRCVLKLINAYEYGIYSEEESDDFKNQPSTSTYNYNSDMASDYMKNNIRKIFAARGDYINKKAEPIMRSLTKVDGQRIKDLMEGGEIEEAIKQFYNLNKESK